MAKGTARNRQGKQPMLNMKAKRIRMNLKAEDMAKEFGISRQWLYKIENGIRKPADKLKHRMELFFDEVWEDLSRPYEGKEISERYCYACGHPISVSRMRKPNDTSRGM
jgi:DNA-binding XRE family transcriptional regulator